MRLDKISADRAAPLFLAVLALLSSGRLLGLNGVFFDDGAWLISAYGADSLGDFLDTGFNQLRRPLMGTFLYFFLILHKILPQGIAQAIWDLTIIGSTFGAALALFHLARRVLGGGIFAPTVAAALLTVHPIDTTLPIYIQVVYHVGVFFALLSLLLTHMAVVERSCLKLFGAVLFSTIASYVFIEGVVTYEAARLVIIGIALYERGSTTGGWGARFRDILVHASPFLASALALAVLKLSLPTYGIYTNVYAMSVKNLLRHDVLMGLVKAALLSSWTYVLPLGLRYGLFPIGLGLAGAALVFALLRHGEREKDRATVRGGNSRAGWMVLVGLVLLLAPALLYLIAGRIPTPGVQSRHGTVLEPGWALLAGGLVAMAMAKGRRSARAIALASALLVGLGVFASNINIAIYQENFDREIIFWEKFVARFPTLPEHAPVIFDVELGGPNLPEYRSITAHDYYHFEFPLSLLYATSQAPEKFRAHPVLTYIDPIFQIFQYPGLGQETLWGRIPVLTSKAIFLHYRNGELLVNREIAARYLGHPYQALLDRPAPVLPPPPPGGYTYRDRVTRYFSGRGGS